VTETASAERLGTPLGHTGSPSACTNERRIRDGLVTLV
jgi:hypothetical protein